MYRITAGLLVLVFFSTSAIANELNGFDLESELLDQNFVLRIGPPNRKSVTSNPKNLPANKANWEDSELVLGVVLGATSRAYPLTLLFDDPLINDTIGDVAILVSFCTLCGSGIVFNRTVDGKARDFAPSGLLYRADELFYDVQTNSLWSSLIDTAVTGPSEGQELVDLSSSITDWGQWKNAHPQTTVLAGSSGRQTGAHFKEERLAGMLNHQGYHPKMPTLGFSWPDGEAIAFPAGEVLEAGGSIREAFNGKDVVISFDTKSQQFKVDNEVDLEIFRGTWHEWTTAHPSGSWYVKEDLAEDTREQL